MLSLFTKNISSSIPILIRITCITKVFNVEDFTEQPGTAQCMEGCALLTVIFTKPKVEKHWF